MESCYIGRGYVLKTVFGITVLVSLFADSVDAKTLTVNASDGGVDYTRIQDAINKSNNCGTILVYSGTYFENVNMNKQLILIGMDTGGGKPIVIAGGNSENAIALSAGNSMLEGFVAYGVGYGTGIIVSSNKNIIRNDTATNYYIGDNNVNGIVLEIGG
jgi:pectin methylesterase-like acyl-CoA thioesterase